MAFFVMYTLLMNLHLALIQSVEHTNADVSSPFTMWINDHIISYNSLVRLKLQSDGNLVIQSRPSTSDSWGFAGWATDMPGDYMDLQSDGELLVVDDSLGIQWTSNSITGIAPYRLIVSDDIAVYILDSANTVIWSTNPSFSTLETIWWDTFDSNNGWELTNDITLPSPSVNCPNSPDDCVKVKYDDGNSDVTRSTVISMYSAIQFQVDISGYQLEETEEDYCTLWWKLDTGDWVEYDTTYKDGIYRDVIIDIPLPTSYTSIDISLEIWGDDSSDRCFFDNAILRGILTPSPTNIPTSSPTTQPTTTKNPTYLPTLYPSNNPISVTTTTTTTTAAAATTTATTTTTTATYTSTEDQTVSITSNPTLNASITTHFESTSIANISPSKRYNTDSTENVKGDTDVATSNSRLILVITITSASIAICACCNMLLVFMICNRWKRRKVPMKRVVSETESQQPRSVLDLRPPPPPVPVELEVTHRKHTNLGLEGGNDDVILTPNEEPNIAPDEFVVVGDDEVSDDLTDEGVHDENDGQITAAGGSGTDLYFERMLSDETMVQGMIMEDIVDEMNENSIEHEYNAPNTFVTPM